MTGLRGRCSSSTRGSRANDAVKPERSEGFDVIIRPAPEPRVLDEQHPSRPVIIPIITRNSQIRDIFTEIRTTELSLNRRRGHLVFGNPVSIATPSVLK